MELQEIRKCPNHYSMNYIGIARKRAKFLRKWKIPNVILVENWGSQQKKLGKKQVNRIGGQWKKLKQTLLKLKEIMLLDFPRRLYLGSSDWYCHAGPFILSKVSQECNATVLMYLSSTHTLWSKIFNFEQSVDILYLRPRLSQAKMPAMHHYFFKNYFYSALPWTTVNVTTGNTIMSNGKKMWIWNLVDSEWVISHREQQLTQRFFKKFKKYKARLVRMSNAFSWYSERTADAVTIPLIGWWSSKLKVTLFPFFFVYEHIENGQDVSLIANYGSLICRRIVTYFQKGCQRGFMDFETT